MSWESRDSGMEPVPPPSGVEPVLVVSGLTVRAGGNVLLDDLSLDARRGEVVLVVGRSGSGKTAFLRAVAGLADEDGQGVSATGKVVVDGVERRGPGRERRVGIVFQDFALFDDYDGATNIDFGAEHHRLDRDPAKRLARRKELLAELGVPGDVPAARLSGRQKQRIAVARALAYDPPCVSTSRRADLTPRRRLRSPASSATRRRSTSARSSS